VLELGGHEFACCLGGMVPANARLREPFQLFERDADTVTVRLTYAVIAAYQSRQKIQISERRKLRPTRRDAPSS
jgi:hypothetical protein